ncbi:helix-turn-helix transcriptional regulator [Rhizosphaericola mali]|uniref:Helix-turn-helix transcriptional regulator n=1 Tax=Rhizosphaericola mali TaxID=2545455 RepID=A0A5P2G4W9_9BACT|nr:AraC family transcriptional regulator [Rhizosphaericola mali]QES88133.1 helix-turn-helix transcriptional regulator [Rhizosphaericola mali]
MDIIYQLPEDFIKDTLHAPDEIIIRRYTSDIAHINSKISLNKNMLQMIISGSKSIKCSDGEMIVHSDELFVLHHGHILTSDIITDKTSFESIILYFSDSTYNNFFARYIENDYVIPEKKTFTVLKQDLILKSISQSIQLLLSNDIYFSKEVKQIKFDELFLHLFQIYPQTMLAFNIQTRINKAQDLVKIVELYTFRNITLTEMAFLCHMSMSTFKRKFIEYYHMTPQKWILKKRLEKAKILLQLSRENLSTIFEQIGYESLSSFSNAFKKEYGISPRKYKDSIQCI